MADSTTTDVYSSLGTGIGGVLSLLQGFGVGQQNPQQMAQQAAAVANPFGTQYGQYQTQLSNLLTNPGSFQTDPGYQFALQQGQDAIKGTANATYGSGRVGGLSPELAKFTEGYANQAYDTRVNQLMNLSGAAPGSPMAAAQALTQGYQTQGSDFASGVSGLLSGLGGLIGNLGKGPDININNSATGGSGGSGGTGGNAVPDGGFGNYGSLTGDEANSPLWSLLGLGNTSPGNGSPIAVPGGLAGLFGTSPGLASSLGSLLGFGSNNPTNPSITNTGIPSNIFGNGGFSGTQGGGLSALFGPNGLFNSGGGNTTTDLTGGVDPQDMSGWMTSDGSGGFSDLSSLLGGNSGSIDWGSLLGGGSNFDFSSLFGG